MSCWFGRYWAFLPLISVVLAWAINYFVYAELHLSSEETFVGLMATTGSTVVRMNYKKKFDIPNDSGVDLHIDWNKFIRDENVDVFGNSDEIPEPKWMSFSEFIFGRPLFETVNSPVDFGFTFSVPFLYLFLGSLTIPMIIHRTSIG